MHGCQNQSPAVPGLEPQGILVAYAGCKNFTPITSSSVDLFSSDSGQECLAYEYGGAILRIKHINAAFNCCLETIAGNVKIEDNVITIESEGILANGQGCFCDCLYDVDYEILNLRPSVYILVFPGFSRSWEIDLRKTASDLYCEPRNNYPWK